MKNFLAVLILAGFSFANAHEVGVIVGSESGLSAKFDLVHENRSIDLALAYNVNSSSALSFHIDYLFDNARTFQIKDAGPLNMYYGLGVRFINIDSGANKGKTEIGARAPLGVDYKITNPDVTFFGELAIVLDFAPNSDVDIDAGVGVRIRF